MRRLVAIGAALALGLTGLVALAPAASAETIRCSPKQAQGNIYLMCRRDYRGRQYTILDAADPQDLTCFRAPSMAEGITRSNGSLYLTFESGSFRYRGDPCNLPLKRDCTRNIIKHLHRASLSGLTSLT